MVRAKSPDAPATISLSEAEGVRRWGVRLPTSPVPAARPKVTKRGFAYYPKRYNQFRKTVERQLLEATRTGGPWEPTEAPVYVWTFFVLPRPANPANPYPIGDLDNYEKAVWDSVGQHAGIVRDDKQFVKSTSIKRYIIGDEQPHIEMLIVEENDFPRSPEDVYDLPESFRVTYEEAGLL